MHSEGDWPGSAVAYHYLTGHSGSLARSVDRSLSVAS